MVGDGTEDEPLGSTHTQTPRAKRWTGAKVTRIGPLQGPWPRPTRSAHAVDQSGVALSGTGTVGWLNKPTLLPSVSSKNADQPTVGMGIRPVSRVPPAASTAASGVIDVIDVDVEHERPDVVAALGQRSADAVSLAGRRRPVLDWTPSLEAPAEHLAVERTACSLSSMGILKWITLPAMSSSSRRRSVPRSTTRTELPNRLVVVGPIVVAWPGRVVE